MKNRFWTRLTAAALCLLLTACGAKDPSSPEKKTVSVEALGISAELPGTMGEQLGLTVFPSATGPGTKLGVESSGQLIFIYYSPELVARLNELEAAGQQMSESEYQALQPQTKDLCSVIRYKDESLEEYLERGGSMEELTGYPENHKLGRRDEASIWFCSRPTDPIGLSEPAEALYEKLYEELPQLMEGVRYDLPIPEGADYRAR